MIDIFGRRKIRQLRNTLMIKNMNIEDLRAQMEERNAEARKLDNFLVKQLEQSYEMQREQRAKIDRMGTMLKASEDARKSLAAKLREAENGTALRDSRFDQLMADYSETVRTLEETKAELDELYTTHNALVRQIRDSQAVSA